MPRTLLFGFLAVFWNLVFGAQISHASTELDRRFTLSTVGALKSYDNVGGFFSEYISSAYSSYFSKQSRFILHDLSQADHVISHSKIPYKKILDDPDLLNQIARVLKVESLIRTKILKEGNEYHVTLDWLLAPQMTLIATETFSLKEPVGEGEPALGDVKTAVQQGLERMIQKLPFQGQVTGRDDQQVTVNLGNEVGLKPGDVLIVGTLEEAKRHPILNAIVDWRVVPTGKLEVESTDENLTFCKVSEEEPGRKVGRHQKILQIYRKPVEIESKHAINGQEMGGPTWVPKLGWVSASLTPGFFSRQISLASGSGKTGGGMILGGKVDGQLWLTRQFFTELGFGFGFWSHSQSDIGGSSGAAASSVSATATQFRIAAGYSLLLTEEFFGPKAALRLGYHSVSYSLPVSTTELTGPVSIGAIFAGIGADIPIRSSWGALFNLDFGVFKSARDSSGTIARVDSTMHASFYLGGYYQIMPKMTLRLGMDMLIQGVTASDGATLSQKIISIAPALLYYF